MQKWKDHVVDRLRDLGMQRAALEAIPLELERLQIESVSIRGSGVDGVAVKGGGDREERMLWNIMQREALERNLEMAGKYVEFVERGLAALEEEEALVVERVYVRGEPDVIERLREEWEMAEKRSVYKRLDKILYRLTVAMFGMAVS
ncbi:MAG: hypothetical protein IIV61_07320 [Oscillospiraceae bacterium]|nr:hypothetical protein [Oscillospiraceae bacterium]MBQ2384385.1 hypothetical protein [Oscillospiraceae bacterium]MBQ5712404.1 hypothetical protein [Oscillospiraceae bacterium]